MPPSPSLKALHSFEAAARLRSLTLAARELNVSVPAVAFQVRQVEEALGRTLLRRSGRGLELAPEGALLARELRSAFDAVARAVEAAARPSAPAHAVTVSVLPSFASLWLLPRLPAFQAAHPDIDVRISTSQRLVDLEGEGVDCAVRTGAGAWPGTESVLLFPQRLAPLCHWSYARRTRRQESAATLRDEALIVNDSRASEWTEWFAAAGVERGEPEARHRVDSRELVLGAVTAGLGIGLLDVSVLGRELEAGDLVQLFPEVLETGWSHWIVTPAGQRPSAAASAFIDWLVAEAQGRRSG